MPTVTCDDAVNRACCPACKTPGDPEMHVEPVDDDDAIACGACGQAGTLEMQHRMHRCETCGKPREGDECEVCGEHLSGEFWSAVQPEEYTCYQCCASFHERHVDGVDYQCPV